MRGGKDLYIIQMDKTGDFKVGRTSDIRRRISELQTGCPYRLKVILHAPGLGSHERRVHKALHGYGSRNGYGEWFLEEGMGSIPDDIHEMFPVEILEDGDWWKA